MNTKLDIANGQFWQGDCLELMRDIPDGSVDMVLCDLPYGTTACSWDSIIPFEPLWSEYKRVLKKNGVAVLFGAEPFSSALRMSNMPWFKYDWVWRKSTPGGFAQAKNMPLKQHEIISVFSEGVSTHASQSPNRITYNPQGLIRSPKTVKNRDRHDEESAFGNRPSHKDEYVQEWTNYPNSVLEFKVERGLHPTQKPVALFEYLIRTYTNPGELVLDNTAGSGTTAVAAERTGRRWICIERDEEYYLQACARVIDTPANPGVVCAHNQGDNHMTNARSRVLATALELAATHRYDTVTRGQLASAAGVATGSVNYYFTDMAGLRDAVMQAAIDQEEWGVVAQGLVDRHPLVVNAAPEVRASALAALGG